MSGHNSLKKLEAACHYTFSDRGLLEEALRHSSYANEHELGHIGSNERLEFLGDAVLEMISSEFLYQHYPSMPEGELTKLRASLVCEPTLAGDARAIGLGDFLLLGKGEDMSGGRNRDSILSDALEALIGAVFLDGGYPAARKLIYAHVLNDIEQKQLFHDSKTKLQELSQRKNMGTPEYTLTGESGPDHRKQYQVTVFIRGEAAGKGTGSSKKAAEQKAAYEALCKLTQKEQICI